MASGQNFGAARLISFAPLPKNPGYAPASTVVLVGVTGNPLEIEGGEPQSTNNNDMYTTISIQYTALPIHVGTEIQL